MRKNLTDVERNAVLQRLLIRMQPGGKLPRGAMVDVALEFGVVRSTVRRIWKRACVDVHGGVRPCADVSSQMKGRVGRKQVHESISQRLQAIPKARRTTFRSIAAAMNVPKTTLHRYYKKGLFIKYSSVLKPSLTDANKVVRLKWSVDALRSGLDGGLRFDDMMDCVHVDEKWLFASRVRATYYLAKGEEPPHRTTKSKLHIMKVMFLSAVVRPRWDNESGSWFDGKIGTWHFTEWNPAKRSSRNRPAGTMELSAVSVTRRVYKQMLINKVIPAIKARWPKEETCKIRIQQDNARPHVSPLDAEIVAACRQDGWDMQVVFQLPNSPDLNVLDLGFFRAIQSLQDRNCSRSMVDIVDNTERAWSDVDPATLNANFLTLQGCMMEVIRCAGGNNYKIPHMKNAVLAAKGRLPSSIEADAGVVNASMELLSECDLSTVTLELASEVAKNLEMSDVCTELERLDDVDDSDDEELDIPSVLGLNI
ncbi:hypothetical protein H257_07758 [Aphanomyces astaci]|uniref:DUF7769 domain-containing protein n=1 Tax=Aphanomyces astaci TaxID=112090 RepID=W4GIW7_APHAT|nr:hypothetical protein H257_07758 [Aphanomyces astaci]ETV78974.1 hypothetical protein H257_07758 [Aphanomyces astaci]|eukprot:XP_009831693.1 hypothetical protein H257_07758 [Aphanomyces astaci]